MQDRRVHRATLMGFLVLCVALAVGCGGGPTGVVGLNVGGQWIEVSTVISDACDIGLDPTSTTPLTIVVDGNQILFVYHLETTDGVRALRSPANRSAPSAPARATRRIRRPR